MVCVEKRLFENARHSLGSLFRRRWAVGGAVVCGKRVMPCDDCGREAGGLGGLFRREIVLFRRIRIQIVDLGRRTVVGAEELPSAVAHREIREIILAGERGAVWRTSEKERAIAQGIRAAEQRLVHGNTVEGGARRSGNASDC